MRQAFGHEAVVSSIAFSLSLVAIAAPAAPAQGPQASPKSLAVFKDHKHEVAALGFSPDGTVLAAAECDEAAFRGGPCPVRLWEVKTGKPLASLKGHTMGVNVVVFAADGKTIASGSFDGTVRLWNLSGKQLKTLSMAYDLKLVENNRYVYGLALAPNGKMLAAGGRDNKLLVWNLSKDDKPRVLKTEIRTVKSLAWSHDGATLAAAADEFDEKVRVELWDVATWKKTVAIGDQLNGVMHISSLVAFSPDSRILATAGGQRGFQYNQIHFWEAATGKYLRSCAPAFKYPVRALAFLPDGKRVLASCWDDHAVEYFRPGEKAGSQHSSWAQASLWDVGTGKLLESFEAPIALNATPEAVPVAVSKDGKQLAVGVRREVGLWPVPAYEPLRLLRGHQGGEVFPLFSPDGKTLVVGAHGEWKLWDLKTDKVIRVVKRDAEGFYPMAFLPGDRLLMASTVFEMRKDGGTFSKDTLLRIWSLKDGNGQEDRDLEGAGRSGVGGAGDRRQGRPDDRRQRWRGGREIAG